MKIFGIGVDLVEISRFKIENYNSIAKRILTESEMLEFLQSKKQDVFLAKKFASKEAVAKSLGVGIGKNLGFKDIEISHNNLGKPLCFVNKNALLKIAKTENIAVHVSIADTKTNVICYAIAEII